MFSFSPKPPKVIYLRGDAPRDIREIPQDLHDVLTPPPIRLRLPFELHLEVIRWLWHERGYHIPTILIEPAEQFSLTVLHEAETFHPLGHPHFTPAEVAQLKLAETIVETIPRFLHRDYVMARAKAAGIELDPRLLSRLSKYLRKLLQTGWTLPPPIQWAELASSAPFDEIGQGLETARVRHALAGPRRTQLIFQALTEDDGGPETLQAIEEFWVASGQMIPMLSHEPHTLLRDLLRNPRLELEAWAQQTPDFEQRILDAESLPAATLPRLTRLGLQAQGLSPEQRQEIGWPLPPLLATPQQQRLACQRLGPKDHD